VQESTSNLSISNDGTGSLYIKNTYGGITTTKDFGALVSKESGSLDVMHSVTDQGLFGQNGDDILLGSQGREVFQ